ncbi:MAG TPA: LytTR family transcriptional regulator DNA-binding domain-containing protein [Parafilimonas sp.]|nr:LytTR family transcriptional regulator DNA-binding domain-containing protein [Parafilimonas sp.]
MKSVIHKTSAVSDFKNTDLLKLTNDADAATTKTNLIRFELKRYSYIWVSANDIVFVISADHYIKSLVKINNQTKWMIKHCTIKELLVLLPHENFIRLNKFYLLNCNYFSTINHSEKIIHLTCGISIPVPHRISRFIIDMIKR